MFGNYDSWKTTPPEGDDTPNMCDHTCKGCPDCMLEENEDLSKEKAFGSKDQKAREKEI